MKCHCDHDLSGVWKPPMQLCVTLGERKVKQKHDKGFDDGKKTTIRLPILTLVNCDKDNDNHVTGKSQLRK